MTMLPRKTVKEPVLRGNKTTLHTYKNRSDRSGIQLEKSWKAEQKLRRNQNRNFMAHMKEGTSKYLVPQHTYSSQA